MYYLLFTLSLKLLPVTRKITTCDIISYADPRIRVTMTIPQSKTSSSYLDSILRVVMTYQYVSTCLNKTSHADQQKRANPLFSEDGSQDPDNNQTIDSQIFAKVSAIQGFIDSS